MSDQPPEVPRSEPEIIPPGQRSSREEAMWTDNRSTHRIYVRRLGPFSIVIILIAIALVAALLLVLVVGAFLIWVPVVAILVAAAIISAWWRQTFRHRS